MRIGLGLLKVSAGHKPSSYTIAMHVTEASAEFGHNCYTVHCMSSAMIQNGRLSICGCSADVHALYCPV